MNRIIRALTKLLARDWCAECDKGVWGGPGGTWWHADTCSFNATPPPPVDRD